MHLTPKTTDNPNGEFYVSLLTEANIMGPMTKMFLTRSSRAAGEMCRAQVQLKAISTTKEQITQRTVT